MEHYEGSVQVPDSALHVVRDDAVTDFDEELADELEAVIESAEQHWWNQGAHKGLLFRAQAEAVARHLERKAKGDWLTQAAVEAEARLRAFPRQHLGPAARRLLDALDEVRRD